MQETVDIVEDVLLRHLRPILSLRPFQDKVGDCIVPYIFVLAIIKQRCLRCLAFFIPVKREALAFSTNLIIWNIVDNDCLEVLCNANPRNTDNNVRSVL